MSYQERRSIVNLISTVLITTLYSAYMIQRFPEASAYSAEVFHFWGAFFLILIPVTIVAKVLIYIVFSIINTIATREEEPPITDERDKLIEMKSTTISLYVFTAGFLLAMGSLVVELPPSAMFIILICSGVVSEMVSDISQFYFYRRGV
ncbi:MAG: hypothetical protein K8J31_20840 [Anaerolineae bacterium]|nr:hypothetical protein [Anaerolineae bacterium]